MHVHTVTQQFLWYSATYFRVNSDKRHINVAQFHAKSSCLWLITSFTTFGDLLDTFLTRHNYHVQPQHRHKKFKVCFDEAKLITHKRRVRLLSEHLRSMISFSTVMHKTYYQCHSPKCRGSWYTIKLTNHDPICVTDGRSFVRACVRGKYNWMYMYAEISVTKYIQWRNK